MRIHLNSGAEADITRDGNGDIDINIVFPPKTYNSFEEGVQDKYNRIYGALIELKKEIPELRGETGNSDKGKRTLPQRPPLKKPRVPPPSQNLQAVKGLDGQTKWVKPNTPPASDEYTWNPPTDGADTAPPPATTYGVTPTPTKEAAQSTEPAPYQSLSRPVNPQSSTYVAQGPHARMLKPGEALTDIEMADAAFPANNESVEISFDIGIGRKGVSQSEEWGFNTDSPTEQNPNIEQVQQQETGFDIGLLANKKTITDKIILQNVHYTDTKTGKDEVSEVPITLREELTYQAAGPERGRGVIETRNVYILNFNNKLVVSQYRVGVEIPVEVPGIKEINKITNKFGVDANAGFTIAFDSPWIDNPIPENAGEKPPTIDRSE